MKNPNSKQFKKVIDTFDKALASIPYAAERQALDMGEGDVDDRHNYCGTPMCHGGWYLVAATRRGINPSTEQAAYCRAGDVYDFDTGAELIAMDLGFSDRKELQSWANQNPELWGNELGEDMFYCAFSFFPEGTSWGAWANSDLSLLTIRNWWADVHNRTCVRAKPIAHIAVETQLSVNVKEV